MSALEKAIKHSKKLGIDELEIVTVKKNITTVRITDSEIIEIKQNFDQNFGIRLIHDKKIASIQTTNEENISDAITKGIKSIKGAGRKGIFGQDKKALSRGKNK